MGQPAAKQGDEVKATDIHIVMVPSPTGQVPTPLPHTFSGKLDGALSKDVNIEGKPAAAKAAPPPGRKTSGQPPGRQGPARPQFPRPTPGGAALPKSPPPTRRRSSSAARRSRSTARPPPATATRP